MRNLYFTSTRAFNVEVSVIVCTYSPAMLEHFVECIKSLVNQSYDDVEVLCIVDGNKDYYKQIKNTYGDFLKNNCVKVFLNDKNVGLLLSAVSE